MWFQDDSKFSFLLEICHNVVLKSYGVFCCLEFYSLPGVVEYSKKKGNKGKMSLIVFMPNFSKKQWHILIFFATSLLQFRMFHIILNIDTLLPLLSFILYLNLNDINIPFGHSLFSLLAITTVGYLTLSWGDWFSFKLICFECCMFSLVIFCITWVW